ncbi:MAG: nucleoside hydrolase [Geminicoccaceae bacterium]
MSPRKIILDCDPGQDDALALLMALGSPDELELLAVTTVAGNVPLALTSTNAQRICALAGRTDVPVYAGADRPLLKPLITAEYVHGETGLDGAELSEPEVPLAAGHAVDAIVDRIMAEPRGSVTLVPTGPLTNVALAMARQPEIQKRLAGIVLMGGAIGLGNVTAAAEFNIFVDPHAAKMVFGSGVPITMHGLDVTHQALITEQRLRRIEAIGTTVGQAAAGLLDFYTRFDKDRYDEPGGPLHDPCTIAYLLKPDLFNGKACRVDVETEGLCAGRTVVDWWAQSGAEPNALVIDRIDADGFFGLLVERVARLGR